MFMTWTEMLHISKWKGILELEEDTVDSQALFKPWYLPNGPIATYCTFLPLNKHEDKQGEPASLKTWRKKKRSSKCHHTEEVHINAALGPGRSRLWPVFIQTSKKHKRKKEWQHTHHTHTHCLSIPLSCQIPSYLTQPENTYLAYNTPEIKRHDSAAWSTFLSEVLTKKRFKMSATKWPRL